MGARGLYGHGFMMVEVMAAVVILGIMVSGVVMAFRRTLENVAAHSTDEQAMSVAHRRMELLLAERQEPDDGDLQGRDELYPQFTWELTLNRVVAGKGTAKVDLSNTVIQALVAVRREDELGQSKPVVELGRFFEGLIPIEGQAVAVPMTYEREDPLWYLELTERLGREPSAEETVREMANLGMLSEDLGEMFGPAEGGD